MRIMGVTKTTLLDYPEKVAATVFVGGCNFKCPFCHNGHLWGDNDNPLCNNIVHDNEKFNSNEDIYKIHKLLVFLEKRKYVLSGVCVTGGEPTLQEDLADFLRRLKSLGYSVKLDTNGYMPDVLKSLARENLIDYVAMDIKSSLSLYESAAGVSSLDKTRIMQSIEFLLSGNLPYEFRTTVVRELHSPETIKDLATMIKGARSYFLQAFKPADTMPCADTNVYSAYSDAEMHELLGMVRSVIPNAELRGVD